MFVLETESIEWQPVVKHTRKGKISRKFLRESEASRGVGYTSDLVRYEPGEPFEAPRHRHNFDQLRFTISGAPDYGMGQVAPDGAVTFFPAGAYYGPEHFDTVEILLVQWSEDWVTRQMSDDAFARLEQKGTFTEGKYVHKDEAGNEVVVDAVNAVWEEAVGRPLTIPTPRYPQPVIMIPEGFEWRREGESVEVRDLGHLTENDFNPVQYRLGTGGKIELTAERTQIVWVAAGELDLGDRVVGARSIVFSDPGETLTAVAKGHTEATLFRMPLRRPA